MSAFAQIFPMIWSLIISSSTLGQEFHYKSYGQGQVCEFHYKSGIGIEEIVPILIVNYCKFQSIEWVHSHKFSQWFEAQSFPVQH